MAKLPKPGDMVRIRPNPIHSPKTTCNARVVYADEHSLMVERATGTQQVVLSDNWVPIEAAEGPKPRTSELAKHLKARAADPAIRRTDANLRAVFGPTEHAKPAPKAKSIVEVAFPGNPGPGEHCDHGQPVEALADLCRDTVAGHCDGDAVGIHGHQVTVDKDIERDELVVVATPNAGRMGRVHKWQISMRYWTRHIGNTKRGSEAWASRVVDLVRDSGYQDLARQLSAASRRRRFRETGAPF